MWCGVWGVWPVPRSARVAQEHEWGPWPLIPRQGSAGAVPGQTGAGHDRSGGQKVSAWNERRDFAPVENAIVKTALVFFTLTAFVAATEVSELSRDSVFDSIDEFVTAVKAFQPAASKGF